MSMRAPYILLSSSKAAAARAFHPSLPPSPVRGSSAAAKAAKAREGGRSSLEGSGSEKGKTSRDSGVSRALPLGHEKGYRLARSLGGSVGRSVGFVSSLRRSDGENEGGETDELQFEFPHDSCQYQAVV